MASFQLRLARKSLMGWPAGGHAQVRGGHGVQPMIETFPLERVADAHERMISGKVRFRSVLKI
jgi:D-arabinose 1-dehydrogenase-like Zn-dependent alcohol dehydrogenase